MERGVPRQIKSRMARLGATRKMWMGESAMDGQYAGRKGSKELDSAERKGR
jgi:hypothetical protein